MEIDDMRSTRVLIMTVLLLLAPTEAAVRGEAPADTNRQITVDVALENQTLHLPATLKTRRWSEATPYNTDVSLDVDLRRLYARLPQLITGVRRNGQGQTVTIANVRCRYANGRIIVQSTTDYRQALTSGFDLTQTIHSVLGLYPAFEKGVLSLKYEVREAAFEGLTQGLLEVTGTDPRTVVKTIFDLYFKDDLTYPLPKQYRDVPIRKRELRLYARDGKFFGLRLDGSARLNEAQYNDLLKRLI
jgi:hypothetical protein